MTSREAKFNTQIVTRRGLLGLGAGIGVAVLTGCKGNEGQGEEVQRGNIVSPEASPSSPYPEMSGASSSTTPDVSISPSASPTMETRLPRIAGEQLNTVWKWMGSATLANAIRSAGEITKGDPAVEGVDRKYWSNAIVLGVPREEVDHETLYLASVTEAPGDAGGDIVSYAKVKQSDLFHGHARNNAGDAVETYSARVRYGAEPARIAFISGDLTGEHPGWSVEPTLVINPSVSLGNATYTQTPVV